MPMGDCLEEEESFSDLPASSEYQEVMQTMRRKTFSPQISPVSSKRPALVNEEDFVEQENWLEEDVRRAKPKRRKTGDFANRSRSFGETNTPRSPNEADILAAFNDDSSDVISTGSADSRSSSRRRQATLLEAGFSKERYQQLDFLRGSQENQLETERPFQHQECTQPAGDPMLFADVDIEGKVFRVPVRMSQLQSKTIKWLAAEAALRYERCVLYRVRVWELTLVPAKFKKFGKICHKIDNLCPNRTKIFLSNCTKSDYGPAFATARGFFEKSCQRRLNANISYKKVMEN